MQNKATRLRSPRRGDRTSVLSEPWRGSLAVRTQPTQQLERTALLCSARQQAAEDGLSIWTNMVWHSYVLLFQCDTIRQSVQSEPFLSFNRSQVCHFVSFIVFVCDVQHQGNVFICPNVDEAFHPLSRNSTCCHIDVMTPPRNTKQSNGISAHEPVT